MPDFGLLGSLRGVDNWKEKEDARRADLTYKAASNSIQQQHIDENKKVSETMANYYNAINKLNVLPKGMGRIKEVSDSLKPQIADSIKKYGGDLTKWFDSQGNVDLDNYLSTVMTHPTTQRELQNATNVAHYQADQQAGLQERMNFDDKGAPVNPFTDQLKKYENGDTDVVNYAGGFKPGQVDEKAVGEQYGYANQYQPRSIRDGKEYAAWAYDQLIAKGTNPQDAKQQAMGMGYGYQQKLASGGAPLQYKHKDWTPQDALASTRNKILIAQGGGTGAKGYLGEVMLGHVPPTQVDQQGNKFYVAPVDNLHAINGALGNEMRKGDSKTGAAGTIENWDAFSQKRMYDINGNPNVSFQGIGPDAAKVAPVGIMEKPGAKPGDSPTYWMVHKVHLNKNSVGKEPETQSQMFPADKTFHLFKQNEHDFYVSEPIDPTKINLALDQLKSGQATKTAQSAFSYGTGLETMFKDAELLQDAFSGSNEAPPAE